MNENIPLKINLSSNIRKVRELSGVSQKEAAALLEISQQSYALYESPQKNIGVKTLEKLAAAFHIPVFVFFLPVGSLSLHFIQNLQKSVENLDDVFNTVEQELYRQKKRMARMREMDILALDKSKALFDELLKDMEGVR